ncbi:MAG: FAD-dependent oxidoreductase [Proteobacteria bacterium]|nr:FAD-dependent oxidoreductase [Pseudomonadota bacterium]
MSASSNKRSALLVAIAAIVIVIWWSGLLDTLSFSSLQAHEEQLHGWTARNPVLAAGSFALLYIVIVGLSLPGAATLTLTAGAVFGLFEGTLIVSFASSLGATVAFLLSRFVLRDEVRRRFGDRLQGIEDGVRRDGAYFLFTLRMVPVVPYFMINLLAGLTDLKARTFYWVSQLGMLPGTLAYAYAGTQLARLRGPMDVLSPGLIGAFGILGLLPWLMRWFTCHLELRRLYAQHHRPRQFDYNLIVIGAGSAGLVSAYIGATARAKVALIERHRMGGDCLNTGCVPSKALLRSARAFADAKTATQYGVEVTAVRADFGKVMARVQSVVRRIAPHDSVERYAGLGVDVIHGEARIVSPWEVEVGGRRVSARSMIVASGARPLIPAIPGIDPVDALTSDNLWELRELPQRLLVLGGGPIGCELSQAFVRFGSEVTLVEMASHLLPREDVDVAAELERRFGEEGIAVMTGCKALRVERDANGNRLICDRDGVEIAVPFDRLLLALGRLPNVEGFGLRELGVDPGPRGTLESDPFLRTRFPNVLVAGDVAGPYQFTHVGAHQAWYATLNGLLAPWWRFKADYRVIPWATFTDPEVARVGLSEDEAKAKGIAVEITKFELNDLDRAITDAADRGFVKVLTPPGKDRILGATVVGEHAGDLLAEFVLAMKHRIGLSKLLGTIHTYPTMSEAARFVAGAWKRAHAPDRLLGVAERYFAWQRG